MPKSLGSKVKIKTKDNIYLRKVGTYKLIKAQPQHAEQIAWKVSNTGYWRAGLESNSLNLDYVTFMVEYVIKPRLPYTYILVEEGKEDTVHGVLTCGASSELEKLSDYFMYLSSKVQEIFAPLVKMPVAKGYVIYFLTLDKDLRGQKLGKKMFAFAENQARQAGCENISLIVWSFSVEAINFYHAMGMMVTQCAACPPLDLPILCMQKNPVITLMKNYLESPEYQNFHFLN